MLIRCFKRKNHCSMGFRRLKVTCSHSICNRCRLDLDQGPPSTKIFGWFVHLFKMSFRKLYASSNARSFVIHTQKISEVWISIADQRIYNFPLIFTFVSSTAMNFLYASPTVNVVSALWYHFRIVS